MHITSAAAVPNKAPLSAAKQRRRGSCREASDICISTANTAKATFPRSAGSRSGRIRALPSERSEQGAVSPAGSRYEANFSHYIHTANLHKLPPAKQRSGQKLTQKSKASCIACSNSSAFSGKLYAAKLIAVRPHARFD